MKSNHVLVSRSWRPVRSKPGPGLLHSHTAVKFLNSMLLFGGERQGQTLNEMWKFHFGKKLRHLKLRALYLTYQGKCSLKIWAQLTQLGLRNKQTNAETDRHPIALEEGYLVKYSVRYIKICLFKSFLLWYYFTILNNFAYDLLE